MQLKDFVPKEAPREITLEELEYRCMVVTNEAFAGNLSDRLLQNFRGFLEDANRYITGKISFMMGPHIRVDDTELLGYMSKEGMTYIDIHQMTTPTLAGLNVAPMVYADTLRKASKITTSLDKDLIRPATMLIGRYINNPEELANASRSDAFSYDSDSYEIRNELAKHLSGDTTVTTKPWGELYESMSNMEQVVKVINEASTEHHKLPAKLVIKFTNDLGKQVQRLIKLVQSLEADGKPVAATTTGAISNLVMMVAREVEFYSVVSFQIETMSKTTQHGLDHILTTLQSKV